MKDFIFRGTPNGMFELLDGSLHCVQASALRGSAKITAEPLVVNKYPDLGFWRTHAFRGILSVGEYCG